MGIQNLSDVEKALSRARTYIVNKSVSTSVTTSAWRSSSIPVAGVIPSTVTEATVPTNLSAGAIPIENAPSGLANYLVEASASTTSASAASFLVADRLLESSGLTVNTTALQSLTINAATNFELETARKGSADLSDLEWWLEWYVATSTGPIMQISVTYTDDSTGNVVIDFSATSGSIGKMVQIIPEAGKYIKAVTGFQCTATTATAGNIGITVTRPITQITPMTNAVAKYDWSQLGLQRIPSSAALMIMIFNTSGTVQVYMSLRVATI